MSDTDDFADDNLIDLAGKQSAKASIPGTPAPEVGVELGVTSPLPMVGGFDSFFGWAQQPGSSTMGEIPRTALVSLDNLVLMLRRDGQARSLYHLLTLPFRTALKGAKWVAPDGVTDADKEVDFANQMFSLPPQSGGMDVPMSKLLQQILLAIPYGFSAFEEVRYIPDNGPLKGLITLQELSLRDARTIRFKVDDKGKYNGFQQRTSVNGTSYDVWIQKNKSCYMTCSSAENPMYGVSLFEAAYTHYEIKRKLYYLAHLAAQFAAVPARFGEIPAQYQRPQMIAFKKALSDFATNTAMTYPAGYKVTLQPSASTFNFLALIDHQNHMMSRSVLAGFIDTENRPALVDINSSDPQGDLFVMMVESLLQDIAEMFTQQLLPKYIDWNFGSGKYPVFKFGPLSDDDKNAMVDVFSSVVIAPTLNCTPEFVRQLEEKLADQFGLDIDYTAIAKMEAAAAQQAQEQAQQQAEQGAAQAGAIAGGAPPEPLVGSDGLPTPPAAPGQGPLPQAGSVPPADNTVSASRGADIDELIEMAQALLNRQAEEDLIAPLDT